MKISLAILAWCAALTLSSLRFAQAAEGRNRVRFDNGWKFHLVDDSVGEPATISANSTMIKGWRWETTTNPAQEATEVTRPGFNDAAWKEITSGHEVIHDPKGMGWFRATLPSAPDRKPFLHFDGVDDKGTVYLNGQKVGEHDGYSESFDVPLGAAWNPAGPNVLTVLVENDGGPGGVDDVFLRTAPAPGPLPAETGPAASVYDDAGWRAVHLPHDFVVEGPFDPEAEKAHGFRSKPTGWYRKKFSLPKSAGGQVLWLEFDGVYRNSIVWLNGRQLGQHASGYTSFYYDISGTANYGGENEVSVWVGWPVINSPMGFMDTCGFPKDKYYYYLSEWGDKPVAHIAQQWNRSGQEGQEFPVWVYGNAARYELFLNGKSLGVKEMPAHEHIAWKVAYAPGTLETRGYDKDAKTIATDKLETTGAPARLEIMPDRTQFLANGEDVVMVRCNLLDAQGRVVPLADDEVTFSVSGPAQVAGVGNGNPSDLSPDKASKRRIFNGHCLAVVQWVDGQPGPVTLTATAPGLPKATATLQTPPVK